MANGKITVTGSTIGALVGGFLGSVVEGAVNVTGTVLKKGAELTKKGVEEGRKAMATGLEKTGKAISDEGIAKRKLSKAEREIKHAESLRARYAKSEPEIVAPKEAANAIIVSK